MTRFEEKWRPIMSFTLPLARLLTLSLTIYLHPSYDVMSGCVDNKMG